MYRIRSNGCASAIFTGLLFCCFSVSAVEIEPSVSIGLEYTDNATLIPDDEFNELIVIATVGAEIKADTGPFQFSADASFEHKTYTKDTFGDQRYFNLGATAEWEMFKDRLDWKLQDFFTQETIDSLDPGTPDNTQDTNVFTFGPNIQFPISARQSITLIPEYRNFSYEVQNIDNQQNSLNVNWSYLALRTMTVGLSGGVNKIDYDDLAISDNTFRNISLVVSGNRLRSDYSISLGTTHVERDNGDSQRGFSGNLTWVQNITGYSNVRIYITSELTDSSSELLSASINPENGEFSTEQISEVLRNSLMRVAYTKNDATLVSSVWVELREQGYEFAPFDQEVQTLGLDFNYPLNPMTAVGLITRYEHTKLTDLNREDDEYSVGGSINYRLSRKLSTVFDINYQKRNSTINTADYDELSVFVSLVYGGVPQITGR